MKLKQWQIKKIIELCLQGNGVEAIAKIRRHSKNTVRKYLRLNGYLPYQYPPDLGTGPPSFFDPSTWSINKPTPRQQGGWFYKELEKRNKLQENTSKQIKELEQQATEKDEQIKKINEKYKETTKELEEYKRLHTESQKELLEERRQKEELSRQASVELNSLRQKNKVLTENYKKLNDTLKHEQDDSHKKDEKIQQLKTSLKQDSAPPVPPQGSSSPQIQSTLDTPIPEKEETDKSTRGVDWDLVKFRLGVDFIKGLCGNFTPKTAYSQSVGFGNGAGCGAPSFLAYSGVFCSGATVHNNAKNTNIRYDNASDQQEDMIHPGIQSISTSMTLDINTSGSLCSGAYAPTYGNNLGAEYTDSPNQNDVIPVSQGMSGDTINISTSGTIQPSEPVMINHIETMNIPHTQSSHYVPPPQISQVYFFPKTIPIPPELIGPCGLIPIRQMDWTQSTSFICWGFQQLYYTIIFVKKSRDKGADILLERFAERLVIQVKHQQANTGIDALKDVLFGKTMYDATRMIVISFASPFTKDALKDAAKAGIEHWDLARFITELRNHNIYYPLA